MNIASAICVPPWAHKFPMEKSVDIMTYEFGLTSDTTVLCPLVLCCGSDEKLSDTSSYMCHEQSASFDFNRQASHGMKAEWHNMMADASFWIDSLLI